MYSATCMYMCACYRCESYLYVSTCMISWYSVCLYAYTFNNPRSIHLALTLMVCAGLLSIEYFFSMHGIFVEWLPRWTDHILWDLFH